MLLVALLACVDSPNGVLLQGPVDPVNGDGWVDDVPRGDDPDDPEPPDWERYEDAMLSIVSPASGSLQPLDGVVSFQAELIDGFGDPIDEPVFWTTDRTSDWDGIGLAFEDDTLPLGLHTITAQVELPNGDVLTTSVGGIRVQHPLGGTYAGFFSSTGTVQGFSFTCAGAATLATGPIAEVALGRGDCTASLIVFDLPLDWQFDLTVDPVLGEVAGHAGAAILGPITYDFPAVGTIDADRIRATWGGTVPFIQFNVDAMLDVQRVSDDTL